MGDSSTPFRTAARRRGRCGETSRAPPLADLLRRTVGRGVVMSRSVAHGPMLSQAIRTRGPAQAVTARCSSSSCSVRGDAVAASAVAAAAVQTAAAVQRKRESASRVAAAATASKQQSSATAAGLAGRRRMTTCPHQKPPPGPGSRAGVLVRRSPERPRRVQTFASRPHAGRSKPSASPRPYETAAD
jgi:hypothetical protein